MKHILWKQNYINWKIAKINYQKKIIIHRNSIFFNSVTFVIVRFFLTAVRQKIVTT
jgi:hypothetical protein